MAAGQPEDRSEKRAAAARNDDRFRADAYALMLSQRCFLHGDPDGEAAEHFAAILDHFPDHALCARELAARKEENGDIRGACETLLAFVERIPARVDLLVPAAAHANDPHAGPAARRALDLLRGAGSSLPGYLHVEAADALREGDPDRARGLLERALKADPSDDEARARLVKLRYLAGDFAQALRDLARLHPFERTPALTRIEAICLFHADRFAEAARSLEAVLAASPDDLFALYYLADIEERRGRGWRADRCLARILERVPAGLQERALAALARIVLDDAPGAEALLHQNLRKDPAHPFSHFVAGVAALSAERFLAAGASFAAALRGDRDLVRRETRLLLKSFRRAKFRSFLDAVRDAEPLLHAFLREEVWRDETPDA